MTLWKGIWVFICIGVIVGIFAITKGRDHAWNPQPISCAQCNIVLIQIDPLRADALAAYGNTRVTTPALDEMAKTGYVFTRAFAVAPWTLPSVMSMMTGVYPSTHTVINKERIPLGENTTLVPARLPDTMVTLAQVLKDSGYVTGGFAGGAALASSYGFNRGYDQYMSEGTFDGLPQVVPSALEFIRAHRNEKMFVFIHGFDVHGQYVPKEGYTHMFTKEYSGLLNGSADEQKRIREEGVMNGRVFLSQEDIQFLRGLYDEKMVRADEMVRLVLDEIKALQLTEKTIVLFTSNHGDEFYEHGRIDHGMTLFDEVIHIPFILVVPGQRKQTYVDAQVRNIDIAPTLLELIRQKPTDGFAKQQMGVSLLPLLQGKTMRLDVFTETDYRYATFKKAIRTWDNWKLISDTEDHSSELYHVETDPDELKNVLYTEQKKKTELMNKLLQFTVQGQSGK